MVNSAFRAIDIFAEANAIPLPGRQLAAITEAAPALANPRYNNLAKCQSRRQKRHACMIEKKRANLTTGCPERVATGS